MADPGIWSPKSTTVPNGQIKINNLAVPSGKTMKVDWTPLNVTSTNRAIKNLEYKIGDNNTVEFRYPTTANENGCRDGSNQCTTANSIQEVADDRLYVAGLGYTPQTTLLIKDSLQRKLSAQAESIDWKSAPPTNPDAPAEDDPDKPPASVPLESTNEEITKLTESIKSNPQEGTIRNRLANINVIYPENISETNQDTILFRLKEIVGRNFEGTAAKDKNFSFGSKGFSEEFGRVILPIQPSISDDNGVEWGRSTLDPLSAFAGRASLKIATSDQVTQEIANQLKLASTEFKENYSSFGAAINLYLAQEAVGAQGLLSRATGAILNPNLELLFNGPTLRSFNFTFRLSPRSKSEAKKVKDIIYFFKAGMAVRKANVGVFLKAPYVFTIKYCSGPSSQHKSLNKIKECALLGCNVDYAPDATYMTFNDEEKTMTSYQLTLRFSELDPIYNTDYADEHSIGY